jgi:hypothetical protein
MGPPFSDKTFQAVREILYPLHARLVKLSLPDFLLEASRVLAALVLG